jgi:hypothetical protein
MFYSVVHCQPILYEQDKILVTAKLLLMCAYTLSWNSTRAGQQTFNNLMSAFEKIHEAIEAGTHSFSPAVESACENIIKLQYSGWEPKIMTESLKSPRRLERDVQFKYSNQDKKKSTLVKKFKEANWHKHKRLASAKPIQRLDVILEVVSA